LDIKFIIGCFDGKMPLINSIASISYPNWLLRYGKARAKHVGKRRWKSSVIAAVVYCSIVSFLVLFTPIALILTAYGIGARICISKAL